MTTQLIDPKIVDDLQNETEAEAQARKEETHEVHEDLVTRACIEGKRFETKHGNLVLQAFQKWQADKKYSAENAVGFAQVFLAEVTTFIENMEILAFADTAFGIKAPLLRRMGCDTSIIGDRVSQAYKSLVFNSESATKAARKKEMNMDLSVKELVKLGMDD